MLLLLTKQISIMSLVFGAVLGAITVIPYIGLLSFLICFFALGAIIISYAKYIELAGELEAKNWAIYGSICGFVGFIGFSISFVPIAALIGFICGFFDIISYHTSIMNMLKNGFFLMIFAIIFIGIMSALMNGFTAMCSAYVTAFINEQRTQQNISNRG